MNKLFDVCFHQIEMKVAAIQPTTQFWNTTMNYCFYIMFARKLIWHSLTSLSLISPCVTIYKLPTKFFDQ